MNRIFLSAILFILSLSFFSCNGNKKDNAETTTDSTTVAEEVKEVNVYSHRHYESDKNLFEEFEKQTGIKVNVVKASADELINKLEMEGQNSPADILITVDAGRLHRAKAKDLLQPIESEVLFTNIPAHLRDADNQWFGITKRARVIVYDKEKVKPEDFSTYESLADAKAKGKLLIRSSSNVYNQSLLASVIANSDEGTAKKWATGVVTNMAREPKGGDRDQIKAIAAGEGTLAVTNTYYFAQMLNDTDEANVNAAKKVAVIFPNQDGRGTHINVSGAAVTKYAPNKENAIKLIEFLTSKEAQEVYVREEMEYPVRTDVEMAQTLKDWGTFKEDTLNLSKLGENQEKAVIIFDEVSWK
ncbi:Fe(3+) ABC transporter substrate-binding protein [Bernardetia sp.]|uniref:Fe(3+) ABC transporter substrate-binding protein n=1 Tax=Bernardetia sp. TaxID=1937974 RepID=UPI0025C06D37|nr:Fe(3+) ABC transporter substrate-binding protein [Bernardetia sp.]